MREPTLDEMWVVIERYGIKREMFEMSNPSEETIQQLYYMIKENRKKKREQEMIRLLKEFIKNLNSRNKS